MNMRTNPRDLARRSTAVYSLDAEPTLAPATTTDGRPAHAWWHRFTSARASPLPPIAPELQLQFADTEATWWPR